MAGPFQLHAPYEPKGDQPEAIKGLVAGVENGERFQTLLGATGTGKTFTIANVIARTGHCSNQSREPITRLRQALTG